MGKQAAFGLGAMILSLAGGSALGQVTAEFVVGTGGISGDGFPAPSNFPFTPLARRGASGGGSTGSGFSSISASLVDGAGFTRLEVTGSSQHSSSSGGYTSNSINGVLRFAEAVRVMQSDTSTALRKATSESDQQQVSLPSDIELVPSESAGRIIGSLARGILLRGDYGLSGSVSANGNTFAFPCDFTRSINWQLTMTPMTPRMRDAIDATSDGSDDVFFHHIITGVSVAWTRTTMNQQIFAILGAAPLEWEIRGSGDMTLDGIADVVWQNTSSGEVGIWVTRPGQLIEFRSVGAPPAGWRLEAVGDYDGDFQPDLVFRNAETGLIVAWFMEQTAFRSWQAITSIPTDWKIITAGDWTGDGFSDLLCHRPAGGEVGVIAMNNAVPISWSGIGFADPARFVPVGRIDSDGNGTQELLWQDTQTQRFVVWSIERRGTTAALDGWSPFVNPLADVTWRARN